MQELTDATTDRVAAPSPPSSSRGLVRRFLDWTGRVLVTVGLLILLFVAYQLWGTGILEARSQNALRDKFNEQVKEHSATSTTTPGATTSTLDPESPTVSAPATTAPANTSPAALPGNGDPVARMEIPRLGLDKTVVEGVDVDDLRQGPGHYPQTPYPGQAGNMAVAGHRTTYGAPFGDADQLAVGDEIRLTSLQGAVYVYKVNQEPFAVSPDDGDVLSPTPDTTRPGQDLATLTLTTCNPKYSAAERLIVTASLEVPPGFVPPPPVVHEDAPVAIAGLSGDTGSRSPTILWGAIVLAMGGLWWFAFHRWPRWYVWLVGAIPFLVVLFVFYTYLERLLPSSY
jgi:sortase A